MALENLVGADKFIANLVPANPTGGDDKREGDDHLRGIKNVLVNTFPNVNGAVAATDEDLAVLTGAATTGFAAVDGTAALPGYSFKLQPWGMFRIPAVGLGFAMSGAEILRMTAGAVVFPGDSSLSVAGANPLRFKIANVESGRFDGAGTLLYSPPATAPADPTEVGFRQRPVVLAPAAYTVKLSDRGKLIVAQTISSNITLAAIFVAGDVLYILSKASAAITIVSTGVTLNFGTGTVVTGNRTLAVGGYAEIIFTAANVATIWGTGLT